jgi:hypothetical protein
MAFFNIDALRSDFETKDFFWDKQPYETVQEYAERSLNARAQTFSASKIYDIFLSHSLKDAPAVMRLVKVLEANGLSVYVDWVVDRQLDRSRVTTENARIIRERLKSSRSFLLALTSNSAQSNWVQWELGLGDGQKNGKVAILPLTSGNDTNPYFYRQEYLGLYPYVDYTESTIWVNGKRWIALKEWLNEKDPLDRIGF